MFTTTGDIAHVKTLDSPFGAGWGIAGLQEVVENPDGSVMIIDGDGGDGGEIIFDPPLSTGDPYVPPPEDFTVLLKSGDGTFSYEYDKEGNMVLRTENATGARREFERDHRNRLVGITDKATDGTLPQTVAYRYDTADRRIAKAVDTHPLDTADAVFTRFVYDRENILLEFVDVDGIVGPVAPTLEARYLHGPGVDQVLAQEHGDGRVSWHLSDHLGSVRDLVSGDGTVENLIIYASFGNVLQQTNPAAKTRYLFAGREYDAEVGLYYLRARYLDPALGRFISEDPIGFSGKNPNLWRYVGNNPVSWVDPNGTDQTVPLNAQQQAAVDRIQMLLSQDMGFVWKVDSVWSAIPGGNAGGFRNALFVICFMVTFGNYCDPSHTVDAGGSYDLVCSGIASRARDVIQELIRSRRPPGVVDVEVLTRQSPMDHDAVQITFNDGTQVIGNIDSLVTRPV